MRDNDKDNRDPVHEPHPDNKFWVLWVGKRFAGEFSSYSLALTEAHRLVRNDDVVVHILCAVIRVEKVGITVTQLR